MSEDLVTLEINGVEVKARPGSMLIEAADANGIHIPRFCYHKKLSIAANCRMCMVEVEKAPKPLPACATPVAEGMIIHTQSELAIAAQKSTMEFLLINHPLDCPVCDQGGECELQDVAMEYGDDVSQYAEAKRVVMDKDIGPLISTDMTRCIHCTRCVRFGEEIAGLREMGATGRGEFVEIGTYIEKTIDSELSGNIIDLCPVGALTAKPSRFYGRPWELTQHSSVASHDCVGSNVSVHTRHGKIVRVVPRDNEEINETWLSDRDRFAYQGLEADDRLLSPMIKHGDDWRECNWEEALQYVSEKLKGLKPADVGALLSPHSTLEELYLAQKYLRGLGINSIDHRLRQVDFSDQENAPLFPWLGDSIESIENLDAALLVGSNLRKDQPILAHRLRKATLKGAAVMAIDSKDYGFNFDLAEQVITDPDGMVDALAGVAQIILKKKGADIPSALKKVIDSASQDSSVQAIAENLFKADQALLLLGNMAAAHPAASVFRALATTIAASSNIKLGYVSEGANAAGGWLAGALPHRQAAGVAAEQTGRDAQGMLAEPRKAYFLWNVEPEYDCWNPAAALQAVSQADCVVVATSFASETMKHYADVMLPIGASPEISGTLVNAEGRWQSFRACSKLPGESRPGWKILRVLGNLGELEGFDYVSAEQVRDELKQQFPTDLSFDNKMALADNYTLPGSSNGKLMRVSSVNNYRGDPITRRATALQKTADGRQDVVFINSQEIQRLGLSGLKIVEVEQDGRGINMPLMVDDGLADGCVYIPTATECSADLGGCYGQVEVKKA